MLAEHGYPNVDGRALDSCEGRAPHCPVVASGDNSGEGERERAQHTRQRCWALHRVKRSNQQRREVQQNTGGGRHAGRLSVDATLVEKCRKRQAGSHRPQAARAHRASCCTECSEEAAKCSHGTPASEKASCCILKGMQR